MGARHELFYDTETALRLVDGEMRAMTGEERVGEVASSGARETTLAALPFILERASDEIRAVLGSLRDSRAALAALDALESETAEKLQHTSAELREGTPATEVVGTTGALRFQDVTTRQLIYAAGVLTDMEARLLVIAKLFDPAASVVHAAR